jgi:hypothetical protein
LQRIALEYRARLYSLAEGHEAQQGG